MWSFFWKFIGILVLIAISPFIISVILVILTPAIVFFIFLIMLVQGLWHSLQLIPITFKIAIKLLTLGLVDP